MKTILALLTVALSAVPSLLQAEITLTNIQGSVAILAADGSAARVGSDMSLKDDRNYRIATGRNAKVTLTTPQGTLILDTNTIVRYSPNGITVEQGRVEILSSEGLTIFTPQGQMLVSGSGTVGVGRNSTAVNMNSGSASLRTTSSAAPVTVNAGQGGTVSGGSEPQVADQPVDLPMQPDASPVDMADALPEILIEIEDSAPGDPDVLDPSGIGTSSNEAAFVFPQGEETITITLRKLTANS